MKLFLITFCLLIFASAFSQYYLRRELKDDKGKGLQGAKITLPSKGGYPFYSGNSGAFGIPVSLKIDTITFPLEGYDTLKTAVRTTEYRNFIVKMITRKATTTMWHLSSLTKSCTCN